MNLPTIVAMTCEHVKDTDDGPEPVVGQHVKVGEHGGHDGGGQVGQAVELAVQVLARVTKDVTPAGGDGGGYMSSDVRTWMVPNGSTGNLCK